MALNDIDALPDNPSAGQSGHRQAHQKIHSGLKSVKAELDPKSVSIPSGLGWDQAKYPLSMTITDRSGLSRFHGISSLTPEIAFDAVSTARTSPAATYWVDPLSGNDTTGTGAQGAPYKSIGKAVSVANAGGVTTKVNVLATATVYRGNNPTNNAGTGGIFPTVDIAFIAVNGRVNTGTFDSAWTASLDGTYTRCYKLASTVTANTINRVVDMVNLNRYGNYTELTNVSSVDLCNNTPDSWYHHSDGNVYINRRDGLAVTLSNTRYYRSASTSFSLRTGVNMYIGGATGNDGFDVEGGHAYGPLEVTPASSAATEKVLAVSNCSFKYGGGKIDNTVGRGVSVDNWHGLAIFSNVRTDANLTDGFNFHNSIGVPKSYALTINCTSLDNGRPGMQSCNGHTLHENVIGVDLCSHFEESRGGTIRNINSSKSLYAGTLIKNDRGDYGLGGGGTVRPTAVRADDTAIIWCDRTRTDMPAGSYEYMTGSGTAAIHKRNTYPVRSPDSGPGTIDTY
jgi:hypothetical protein